VSDTAWLIVAISAGVLFALAWLKREQWIHRRRTSGRADIERED
jgi:hypothetical protein